MKGVHGAFAVVAIAAFAVVALYGAWCWWQARHSAWFWRLLRAAQVLFVVQIALGGLVAAGAGRGDKASGLHLLYGGLPLLVSLFAEQFRITSAQSVLDARGLADSAAVGKLPAADQREVVVAIMRREVGVMALGAVIIVVLLSRAVATG